MKAKTKPKTKLDAGRKRYNEAIAALVQEAATRRGFVMEVTRQWERITRKPIFRQTIDSWLHQDAKRRIEPQAGSMLLLLESAQAARQVMDERENAKEKEAA